MNEFANAFLLVYAGLFPIINPPGSAPLFLGLTRNCTTAERHMLARRVALNSFLLVLGSLLAGSYILEFFGITLPAVRMAGGLVVSALGWKMLHTSSHPAGSRIVTPPAETSASEAFYPLTMPLTVGPGSLSVAITLGSQRPSIEAGLSPFALTGAGAVGGLIAIAGTVYVCYRFAARIVTALGEQGNDVLMRLSSFILLCIGVQIVWNGVSPLIGAVH